MRQWYIPVEWAVCDTIKVEAETLEDAIRWTREHADEIPCGDDATYIDGSWKITGDERQSEDKLAKEIEIYQE